jgi:hypothetical protein
MIVLVEHGAFTPENDFTFTGSVKLDAPKTVHVKAVALAPWASGRPAGGSRETTVRAPKDCETTTTESTTTTSVAPTTTVAPPTTQPPSSSVGPSTTVVGRLPFSGSSTVPMLVVGLILVAGGAAFVIADKRRGLSG